MPAQGVRGRDEYEVMAIYAMRNTGATGGNASPKDLPANVTRLKSVAAKGVAGIPAAQAQGCGA